MLAAVVLAVVSACVAEPFVQTPLVNKTPSYGFNDTYRTQTVLDCARRCSGYNGCRSLFYVQNTGECQTHGAVFTPASLGLIDTISTVYYEKVSLCAPSPFVCPATNEDSYIQYCDQTFSFKLYFDMTRVFSDAKAICKSDGAHLIEILTVEKMNFARQLVTCRLFNKENVS